ncbi:MAG: hypothetical protein CMF50_09550 [Legionellales bacterium]|nr:hypothetical protein [Legionellales bacterium]|tara:strand:- start:3038 stop:3649 length:612 start_codon:yes stop_codon:yes gene_type:complete
MGMSSVRLGLGVILLLSPLMFARAGIYMGTDQTVPHEYQASSPTKVKTNHPPLSKPFSNSPVTTCTTCGQKSKPKPTTISKSPARMVPLERPYPTNPLVDLGKNATKPPYQKPPYRKVKVKPPIEIAIRPGSLRENVNRVVRRGGEGYRVIWELPNDYNWVGRETMTGYDTKEVLAKLLQPYPVQAVFYQENHIIAIKQRRRA